MRGYTTIEQSKKLLDFGLNPETADMRYGHIAPYEFSDRMYDGGYDKVPYPKDFLKLCADFCEEDIYDGSLPCWSLAALIELMPFMISLIDNYYSLWFGKNETTYFIGYGNVNNGNNICKFEGEDFVSVVVDATCWLLENKYIKTKQLWKPTGKQIEALRRVKAAIAGEGVLYNPLNSLFEQLKAL